MSCDIHRYFDWAAATPPDRQILEEALHLSLAAFANPSSAHRAGNDARKLLESARERCSRVLGVKPAQLVFTSGGTEADHLPLLSLLQRPSRGSIVVSAIEHPAISEQVRMLKNCGWNIITVAPERDGIVTPEAVASKIQPDTALVCVMAVNNETGAVQPVREITAALADVCQGKKKPLFHTDAVQAAGKIPFNTAECGADSASFSAHKLRGPRGIGLLYLARRQEPFIRGGGQEEGLRPGTENLAGILAMAACLEKYALPQNLAAAEKHATLLADFFISELSSIPCASVVPRLRAEKPHAYSPWIIQASFGKIPGSVMVRALSEQGFYISTGSACSARKQSRPVLEAMGVSKDEAASSVRFSFGNETEHADIERLLAAVRDIAAIF